MESYRLEEVRAGEEAFQQIMDLLGAAYYRTDFRNLLPSVEAEAEGKETAMLTVLWEDGTSVWLQITSGGVVNVHRDDAVKSWHTNTELAGKLIGCMEPEN